MTPTKRKGEKYGFPALLSFFCPGFGQLIKGEAWKGIGIFVAWGIAVNCWWLFHISIAIELALAVVIFWPQVYDAYETGSNTKNGIGNILPKPILLSMAIGVSVLLSTLSYFGGTAYVKDIQKKALIKGLDQQQITVELEYDKCIKSASGEKYIEEWNRWCGVLGLDDDCKLPTYYADLVDQITKLNRKYCVDIRQASLEYINSTRNSL